MQSKKTPAMLAPDMPLFLSCLNSPSFENKAVWFANQRYYETFVKLKLNLMIIGWV